MSTLRTFNLQNPDSGTVNIEMDQGGNTLMTGIATVRGAAHFTSTSGSDAVGIGTDITAYKLDVRVTGAEAGLRVYNPDTSSNASGIIRLGNDDNQNSAFLKLNGANNSSTVGGAANLVLGTGTAREVHLATNGTSRLRITSAGYVGINKTPTTYQFEVNGGTANTVASFESTDATSRILFKDNSGEAMVGAVGDALTFYTSTNATERLRITSGGYVNIGGDLSQTSRKVMINGGSNVGQLEVKGTEADIWMNSTGPSGGSVWRVMGCAGNNTHRWRVYDSTNSRDCINVYNDGSVVTPVQPRFFARLSANQTSYDGRNVGGTWITYDVEDYDIGGNFATSGADQGRFIAPVSGLYLFHAAAYKQSGTADWSQSWFDIDGSRANGTDFVHSSSTRFAQNAIQVYLTAGQKIGFHPYNNASGNNIIDTGNHTWFKGCLLG